MKFTVSTGRRLMLFLCVTLLCFIIGSVAVGIVTYGGLSAPRLRIATVIQDVVMFIIPPVATAVMITRRPAEFLLALKGLRPVPTLLTIAIVLASIPAMNAIISWNQNLTLPSSMGALEEWMRTSEAAAKNFTDTLLGGSGAGSLIMALLIVGLLAGLSEELFFRGGLQRLLSTSGMNIHCAVWVTAFIFSAVHMQFFGFVPRLLLGAFFGYLAAWSGCIWLPVTAHALNNALATVAFRLQESRGMNLDDIGTPAHSAGMVMCGASIVVTALLLVLLYRWLSKERDSEDRER
ncbi:MAG: CPBP family intramembrane metalloprotease [Bacteroides sp.]|nr:CPBP family intramembrane metalloprotease [Bacteroides sp.]